MRLLRWTWRAGLVAGALVMAAPAAEAQAPARRAMTIDDFLGLRQASDLQVAPDGKLAAFTVTVPNLDENRARSRIWLVDLERGESWEATSGPGSERAPRWAPDGRLGFVSTRSGAPQVWVMPARAGELRKLTEVPSGVSDFTWTPDGKALLVTTDVRWPAEQEIDRLQGPYPTGARLWTELFYRHWNEWRAGTRQHLLRVAFPDSVGVDLTPFDRDAPTLALGGADVATSPLGTEIAFVMSRDTGSAVARSTNNDIYVMGPDGEGLQPLTTGPGSDHSPAYSPDGKYLAFLSMQTGGFEADRQQLMLYERATGALRSLTTDWSLSVGRAVWTPDSKALVAEVEERGEHVVYRIDVARGRRTKLVGGGVSSDVAVTRDRLVFLRQSAVAPPEVFVASPEGKSPRQVTTLNTAALAALDLSPVEKFGFVGAEGDSVFGWIVKPPAFDPARRYPLVYLVHGGPQGAWLDQWHARWNYALFASRGYVVAAVNFHGSTGYGQSFTNKISRHWGDLPYEDLMRGLEVVGRLPFVDPARAGAAGGSYGGYMVNWMAGHTKAFKALVSHSGIFNTHSMAGTTEELWFPHWEFGGTPLDSAARATMDRFNPAAFASAWSTPMLVVHGQLDYRVDVSEGLQAFTALKLRNVPARFLYFPDEGHWVLKPRNRRLWWATVLDWLDQWLRPGS